MVVGVDGFQVLGITELKVPDLPSSYHCSCPPLSSDKWPPVQQGGRWGGCAAEVLHAGRGSNSTPVVTKRPSVLQNAGPAHTQSLTHMQIKWGFHSGCKRLYWCAAQACLWPQCCWWVFSTKWRIIKEAHTAWVYKPLHEGAFNSYLSSQTNKQLSAIKYFWMYISRFDKVSCFICLRCGRASGFHSSQGCILQNGSSTAGSSPSWNGRSCGSSIRWPPVFEHLLLTHRPPFPLQKWPRYGTGHGRGSAEPQQQLRTPSRGL